MINVLYQYVTYFFNRYWFNPSYVPHPIHRNKYFVTYEFEGKPYNILISKKRGPAKIIGIFGNQEYEKPKNVYEDIKKFLGPNFDFHDIKYTPKCLGYYCLTFCFSDDSEKTFIDNDVITL